jgi:hypothetical protein
LFAAGESFKKQQRKRRNALRLLLATTGMNVLGSGVSFVEEDDGMLPGEKVPNIGTDKKAAALVYGARHQ